MTADMRAMQPPLRAVKNHHSVAFTEPKSPQESVTGHYNEPRESRPRLNIGYYLRKVHLNITLPFIPVSSKWSFGF